MPRSRAKLCMQRGSVWVEGGVVRTQVGLQQVLETLPSRHIDGQGLRPAHDLSIGVDLAN